MKINVSTLRRVIKEEIQRAVRLHEAGWGTLGSSSDAGAASIEEKLAFLGIKRKVTKTADPVPTYWFSIMDLADDEVEGLLEELPGEVELQQDRIFVRMTGGTQDVGMSDMGRDPGGQSVWDDEE